MSLTSSRSPLTRSPRSYDLSSDASSSCHQPVTFDSSPSTPPPSYAFPASSNNQSPTSVSSRSSSPLPRYTRSPASAVLNSYAQQSPSPSSSPTLGGSGKTHQFGGFLPLSAALTHQVVHETEARREKREQLIRAKLEPLLFPAPRPFGSVVKGLFGVKKERLVQEELSEEEKRVGEAMVLQYRAE